MNRPIAKPLVSIIRDLSLTGQPFLSQRAKRQTAMPDLTHFFPRPFSIFHAKACNNPFAAAYL